MEFSNEHGFCKFRVPNVGSRVLWEITSVCNYRCSYCIFSSGGRARRGELDAKGALEAVGAMERMGVSHLKITGGEPMGRADIFDVLLRVEAAGMRWDLSTNASGIGPSEAARIAMAKPSFIHVSLDGPDDDSHCAVRGAGTFWPTIRGLEHLAKAGVSLRVGCVVHAKNEDRITETARFAASLGAQRVVFSRMEAAGRMRVGSPLLCDKGGEWLLDRTNEAKAALAGVLDVHGSFGSDASGCSSNSICPGGERMFFLDCAGVLSPCSWARERLGKVASGVDVRTAPDLMGAGVIFPMFAIEALKAPGRCPAQFPGGGQK